MTKMMKTVSFLLGAGMLLQPVGVMAQNTLEWVIPPQFEEVLSFSEGVAAAKVDGLWGFIDKTGQFVIEPQYAYGVESFSDGYALIQTDWVPFYINKDNEEVMLTAYDFMRTSFSDGVAVCRAFAVEEPCFIIDTDGNPLTPIPDFMTETEGFRYISPFKDGVASAMKYDPDWSGYVEIGRAHV